MIEELEIKTQVITFTGDNLGTLVSFVPDEDVTLRQVHLSVGHVWLEPNKTAPTGRSQNADFYLNSAVNKDWTQLAFPLHKGTALYWAPPNAIGVQLLTLVMT